MFKTLPSLPTALTFTVYAPRLVRVAFFFSSILRFYRCSFLANRVKQFSLTEMSKAQLYSSQHVWKNNLTEKGMVVWSDDCGLLYANICPSLSLYLCSTETFHFQRCAQIVLVRAHCPMKIYERLAWFMRWPKHKWHDMCMCVIPRRCVSNLSSSPNIQTQPDSHIEDCVRMPGFENAWLWVFHINTHTHTLRNSRS